MGHVDWGVLGQSLPALTSLRLQQCDHVSLAAVQAIAGLNKLRRLQLDSCMVVTDAAVEMLAALTALTHLDLSSTQVSRAGTASWHCNLPCLCWVVQDPGQASAPGSSSLRPWPPDMLHLPPLMTCGVHC